MSGLIELEGEAGYNCRVVHRRFARKAEKFRLSQPHMENLLDVVIIVNMEYEIGFAISLLLMQRYGWMRVCDALVTPYLCGVASRENTIDALRFYNENVASKIRSLTGPIVVVIDNGVEIFEN